MEKHSHPVWREFFRYFWAGSLAFGSDFATMVFLTELLQVNYLISNFFGFFAGLGVGYLLCIKWVFKYRRFDRAQPEFMYFTLFALLGFAINELLLWAMVGFVGFHYALSKIIAAGTIFVFNFILRRYFLFSRRKLDAKTFC